MTEGQLLARASELTSKVAWLRDYRQKWQLLRYYCECAADLQHKQHRVDRGAEDMLIAMISTAQLKVEKIDSHLAKLEPELRAIMREVDHESQDFS